MVDKKRNVFISHVHEDDDLLPKLKDLVAGAGMEVRDGSVNSDKPNEAQSKDYIMNGIIAPRIQWASTLVVLITPDTAGSDWVNREIEYAEKKDKVIVGVFAQGATSADIPEALDRCGDAALVGWNGDRIVSAINGELKAWEKPDDGGPRTPRWTVTRYSCG